MLETPIQNLKSKTSVNKIWYWRKRAAIKVFYCHKEYVFYCGIYTYYKYHEVSILYVNYDTVDINFLTVYQMVKGQRTSSLYSV